MSEKSDGRKFQLPPKHRERIGRVLTVGIPIILAEVGMDAIPNPISLIPVVGPLLGTMYGWRDIEAVGWMVLGWHPVFGHLEKGDRKALFIGAAIPWMPPTLALGTKRFASRGSH